MRRTKIERQPRLPVAFGAVCDHNRQRFTWRSSLRHGVQPRASEWDGFRAPIVHRHAQKGPGTLWKLHPQLVGAIRLPKNRLTAGQWSPHMLVVRALDCYRLDEPNGRGFEDQGIERLRRTGLQGNDRGLPAEADVKFFGVEYCCRAPDRTLDEIRYLPARAVENAQVLQPGPCRFK